MRGALTQWGWRQFISWLVHVPRPTLLRVEVPVALNAGTVQLMIETPDGQVGISLLCIFRSSGYDGSQFPGETHS